MDDVVTHVERFFQCPQADKGKVECTELAEEEALSIQQRKMRTRVEPASYGSRPESLRTEQFPPSRHYHHHAIVVPPSRDKTVMTGDCLKSVKYTMLILNTFFFVAGVLLLGVGLLVELGTRIVGELIETHPLLSKILHFVMAVGSLLFLLGLLGWCGALRENRCVLLLYFAFISSIFLAQIGFGIFAITQWGTLSQQSLSATLTANYKRGNMDDRYTSVWRKIMHDFSCCGVRGVEDFGDQVPLACCRRGNTTCDRDTAYALGCFEALYNSYTIYMYTAGALVITVMIVELITLSISMCLFRGLRPK
ncbi:tetraspanin-18-like [Hippocampus zosterae]|uniref:tetraspanin-18-like n=1 Tax=Hippocampus zosterae TaxID=109293 RepID=UPI00223D0103|nr:tetraspanin-18-like [Hippocampus zosterae]